MKRWCSGPCLFLILAMCLFGMMAPLSSGGALLAQAGPAEQAGIDCSLLDDPEIRARMSAAFELALLEACGRFTPGPAFSAGEAVPAAVDQGGPDVRVNIVDPAATSTTQSETSIAINKNTGTLCAHWNDSYHYLVQGLSYIGFANSTDGGQTWNDTPTNYLPQGGGGRARGDPSVAWRAVDGYWYATSIHLGAGQGLGFWRSTDDCATFEWVGMAHAGSSDDKELLAIDNSPGSPYYGRMYIAWMEFGAGRMSLTYSDNGTTWSTPVPLSYDNVQGAWPAVAPNGDVYVAWVRWISSDRMDMEVSRSTNGGVSFTRVTNPASNVVVPRDAGATSQCGRAALNGRIRYLPSPQIVVGPEGCLHVVYPYDPDGYNVGDVINAYYRRSCDHGTTWGPEVLLNDDGGLTDQFFPNVAVNEDNVVAASWYDRRLDPGQNLLFDRYLTLSTDGGVTWGTNERVSDVSSPVYIDPNMSTCYHGDYDQLAADANWVYALWSDDRVFFNGHYDPDLWFEPWPLACEPVVGAGFTWEPITPTVGLVVTFTGEATGTLPIAYSWELGDGGLASGQVVTHSYGLPGVYAVTMTATNCLTATATAVHTVTVLPCEPVVGVDFAWEPITPIVGEVVTLTGAATGTLPITFSWGLGDGGLAGGQVVTHSYSVPEMYTVTMTATNCLTATATAVHTITVLPEPCEAVHDVDFTWEPVTPTVGQVVTFTGMATGTLPITYTWDVGVGRLVNGELVDGGSEQGEVITHVYELPGEYLVVLTATNCQTATATAVHTITVLPEPCEPVHGVGFTWEPITPTAGQVVTFTGWASGTEPITYSWGLEGGRGKGAVTGYRLQVAGWKEGAVVTHTYELPRVYTVVLTATNCQTATATAVHTITVLPEPCEAVEIVTVTQGISGCVVTFGAELTGASPFTFSWDFGLFGVSTETNPVVDFGTTGVYTGTLEVWNCGGSAYDIQPFTVVVQCVPPIWKVYLPIVFRGYAGGP